MMLTAPGEAEHLRLMRALAPFPRIKVPLIGRIGAMTEQVHVHARIFLFEPLRTKYVQHLESVFCDRDVTGVRIPFFETVERVAIAQLLRKKSTTWYGR